MKIPKTIPKYQCHLYSTVVVVGALVVIGLTVLVVLALVIVVHLGCLVVFGRSVDLS